MAIFIYSQSFRQKSAVGKSTKKYFLYFVLMAVARGSNPGLTSNKSTQYLLDYDDFNESMESLNVGTR